MFVVSMAVAAVGSIVVAPAANAAKLLDSVITSVTVREDEINVWDTPMVDMVFAIPNALQPEEGDTFTLTLPPEFVSIKDSFPLKAPDGSVVAVATVANGVYTFTLTDYFDDHDTVSGKANFEVDLASTVKPATTIYPHFLTSGPAFDDTVKIKAVSPTNHDYIVKTGYWVTPADQGIKNPAGALNWRVQSPQGPWSTATFTDEVGGGHTIDCLSLRAELVTTFDETGYPTGTKTPVPFATKSCGTSGYTVTVVMNPAIAAPNLVRVLYSTTITDPEMTTYTNEASVTVDTQATQYVDGHVKRSVQGGEGVGSQGATVGDYVWIDTNRDGIQDAGEPGLAGVELELIGPDGQPVTDLNGTPLPHVTTGADGKYLFDELPLLKSDTEHYTVRVVSAPGGYVPTMPNASGDPATDSSTTTAESVKDLTQNRMVDDTLDFGYVVPAVSVGDYVWLDTDGDGIQDAGEPGIAGVQLEITGPDGDVIDVVTNEPVAPVTTDADGAYSFDNLPALPAGQHYTVTVVTQLDGYAPTKTGQGTPATDSSTNTADSGDLTTDGARDDTLDFGYVPKVSVGDFVWVDTNKNGVQDAGEPGIEGVTLMLVGPDNEPVTDVNGTVVARVVTDADGKYSFDNLPTLPATEHYTVIIDADASAAVLDKYVPTKTGAGTPATDSSTDEAESGDLTEPGARDDTLDFGFYKPSASVGDYVWEDTNKNGVQDAGEPGIEGVTLTLTGPNGAVKDVDGNDVTSVTTDADGAYTFDNLPLLSAGETYTVTIDTVASAAVLAPYVPTTPGAGTPATDSSTGSADSAELTADGDRDDTLDFGFTPKSVSVGDYVWIDVNKDGLQDAGEPGIAGATLTLTGPNGAVTDVNGDPVEPVTTKADGSYSFDNLPALGAGQHYTVTIDEAALAAQGFIATQNVADNPAMDSSTGSADSVELTKDGSRDPTLDFGFYKPSVSVGDYVWRDVDKNGLQDAGEPGLAGVTMTLTGPDGKEVVDVYGKRVLPVQTGVDGAYSFDNLPMLSDGERYTVTIDASGLLAQGLVPTLNVADNPALDSSTGSAASTGLTTDGERDATLDFGFIVRPPQADEPSVAVGNFVWFDANADGVQDANEPGIPNVTLTLIGPDGPGVPVIDIYGEEVGPATTVSDGFYYFGGLPVLPEGQHYTVVIDSESPGLANYEPTIIGGTTDTELDSSTGSADARELMDFEYDTSLDFGFVLKPVTVPTVSVGDFVWIDTDKDGIQDADEPGLAGATLSLTGPDGQPVTDAAGSPVAPITTGTSGAYSFTNLPVLPAGQHYTVTVTPPAGYDPTVTGKGTTATDSSTGSAVSTDLTTDGASDTTLDFGFVPKQDDTGPGVPGGPVKPSVYVGNYVWFDVNRDGIQNDGSTGIKGVKMTLVGPDGKAVVDVYGKAVAPRLTDKDGYYVFSNLPILKAGQYYTVRIDSTSASLAKYIPTKPGAGTNRWLDSSTGSAKSGALLRDGAFDYSLDFGFIVSPTKVRVSVGNHVWYDKDKDGRQDEGEVGIPGVKLTLVGPDGKPVTNVNGIVVGTATTNSSGWYTFVDLPALPAGKHYTVRIVSTSAALAKYTPTKAGVGTRGGDSSTGSAVSADLTTAGARDATLDFGFVLRPVKPSVSVGNRVWFDKDKDGRQDTGEVGIPGVKLTLVGPDGKPVTNVNGIAVGTATTDSTGWYTFANLPVLPAGKHYTVKIVSSSTALAKYTPTKAGVGTRGGDSSTGSAVSADLTTSGARDATLDFGFVLKPLSDTVPTVTVGDFVWVDVNENGTQEPGEPGIPGVTLTLTGPDGNPVTDVNGTVVRPVTTDAEGKYSFVDLPPLPAGQHYTVTITPPSGYAPTTTGMGDSTIDSSTGSAMTGDLVGDGDSDTSLDFGFVVQPALVSPPTPPTPRTPPLAATGLSGQPLWAFGGAMVVLGILILGARRRKSV